MTTPAENPIIISCRIFNKSFKSLLFCSNCEFALKLGQVVFLVIEGWNSTKGGIRNFNHKDTKNVISNTYKKSRKKSRFVKHDSWISNYLLIP